MTKLIPVAAVEELPPGSRIHFDLEEESVILLNIDGVYYCIADLCTHDGGPLADGEVLDHQIECPRHGARFDVRSGRVTRPPAAEPIPTYPVHVENGMILIEEPDYW